MFRTLLTVGSRLSAGISLRYTCPQLSQRLLQHPNVANLNPSSKQFGTIFSQFITSNLPVLSPFHQNVLLSGTQVRTVTKFSLRKGKRKAVKSVLKRFFRLHWGGWIRTHAGRHKKLWKKSSKLKHKYKNHVFCNPTQSYLLDKMVTKFWRKPKYYVDDPYAPYHTRDEFPQTRFKPL